MVSDTIEKVNKWNPLLTEGSLKEGVMDILPHIKVALDNHLNLQNIPSLFFGNLSASLFYSNWCQFDSECGEKEIQDKIYGLVENSIDLINSADNLSLSYVEGVNGIAWAYQYLLSNGALSDEIEDCLIDFDEIIIKELYKNIKTRDLDLFYGVCGNLNYLIERHAGQKIALEIIPNALRQINDILFDPTDGILNKHQSHEIIFGFAHGFASVLSILCKIAQADQKLKENCQDLYFKLFQFYASFKQGSGKNYSYPNVIDKGQIEDFSPIRWCHGEMGPALAFAFGGVTFNSQGLIQEAIDTGLKTISRMPLAQQEITEYGVCHGAAGNAHLYARLYNYTGEDAFAEAAKQWLRRALEMAYHKDGLAGFKVLSPNGKYVNSINFLNGISGLGLVLISAIAVKAPTWDKCIMLS